MAGILIAMLLGILIGYMIFLNVPDKAAATRVAGYISIASDIFLRLIKMAAMAATVAINGLSILVKFAVFMRDFYLGLIVLWVMLVFAGWMFLGRRVFKLVVLIREAFLLSFATASSESAYPKIFHALDRLGSGAGSPVSSCP